MKVIFDISSVGDNPKTRTGVARTAWSLADLLHQKLGDNLSFSATGSIEASLQTERLLNSYPDLRSAIYPVNSIARSVNQLNTQFSKNYSGKSIFQKTQQSTLVNISRLFNIIRQPIAPEILAEADIFHSSYPRIPKQVRKALPNHHLQTVYDLTPLILDEKYFLPGQRGITKRLIDTIQPNDWVTTISDATRNDLLNRRQLNPEKVVTIYLAASPELFYPVSDSSIIQAAKQKYHLPEGDYFLSLHSLAPHKNMDHLIACFKQVIMQEKKKDLHLVICGGNEDAAVSMINANQLTEADLKFIHFTGFVDDNDLAAIYSGAIGFIFPSLYEGFGLPVLEAMQCGCPVISSNTSSLPEVVGDAGFLVSPTDKDALCESILKLYCNSDLRAKYSQYSVDRAALFSWEKTASETLKFYRSIRS
ncbi:glycosyltransferase family 4 protein [Dolichospermum sp. ST_sed1]|nr:glycosyltransferase family 4 protein [Dolichospermum sp. ST_sed1]MDD1424256.1 glycosyltransferase family 4 protein [Dolichospermum sp. ST_sed9]MDD1429746.1 glycosyltransferase family 4 protein [Dolichospermum sp. ST_sed6]MDD1436897.1 glycosyltransferase family 4 protein [Dolichospermum sp. ST_sed10]MDD1440544.1 glycosyltransferase family 4 protein [Dolichospermum sp. ST_sed3]MDD1446100.1 glycosyltransferase family 4 protein [Dolichospermum sp. ST_sed8]MDD1454718.1 glycosyltransferase famil